MELFSILTTRHLTSLHLNLRSLGERRGMRSGTVSFQAITREWKYELGLALRSARWTTYERDFGEMQM
jgi:hypothetical protein